jgi:hypothetical protein
MSADTYDVFEKKNVSDGQFGILTDHTTENNNYEVRALSRKWQLCK